MWRAAERWYGFPLPNARNQGIVTGIVDVCRWLAGVTTTAPATQRSLRATEWTIEDEVAAIEVDVAAIERGAVLAWTLLPVGRADGVILAFVWAWLGGDLPVDYFEVGGSPESRTVR